ncbi:MAG: ABC transporter permease [Bryobacteraceae bacterium]|jgi:predicted permease
MLTSIKHAFRVLRRDPGFTAVAICSMALGIGATAAMFSFADAILLRPLPVAGPDRVVAINTRTSAPFGNNTRVSYPDYADLRDHNRTFDGLVAASYAEFGFSPDTRTLPRMKFGLFVSGNFFRVLGVEPALGRGFRSDEDQAEGRDAVVVLGHDFWVSQYDASPSVLGSRMRLNGIEFTVIGVAPEHFTGIDQFLRPALFVPLAMSPRMMPVNLLRDRDAGALFVKGRLKPGVSVDQARADIESLAPGLQKLHTQASDDLRLTVETELQLRLQQAPPVIVLPIMLGALGLSVLLVACANVAGLLLSRARARSREIAVRLALGAGRGSLIRQLLLENLFVAVAGGVGGLAVADVVAGFWRRIPVPTDVPAVFNIGVDHRVLFFTMAVSVLSTLLFGLAPAFRVTRPDLVPALKAADADSGGKRRMWGRNTIVAGQVALSLVLLAVAASLVQGFRDEFMQGPGYRTDHLFLTSFDTQLAHYSEEQARRYYDDLLHRTRSAPGVRSAALVSSVPMAPGADSMDIVPEGSTLPRGEKAPQGFGAYISDGYFRTVGIPIVEGRGFLESDRENAPRVAVVNQYTAMHYWPKGDALGKRFHLQGANGELVQIVGIARRAKYRSISEPPTDFVYLPVRQHPRSRMSLVAESDAADAATIAPVVREVVRSLDPDMPVFDVRTMHDLYTQRNVKVTDIIVQVVAALGLMGLLLAVVGLYGLVAYSVSRRTREIGIRMAIGADRRKVVWMVLRQGLELGVAGVAAGVLVSFFACRMVTSALSMVTFERIDPLIFAVLPLLLVLVTVLATWAPARRASLIDPMRALRDE